MRKLVLGLAMLMSTVAHAGQPETVAVTYHVRPENEQALRSAIDRHRATGERLGLFTGSHQLFKGNGFFLEIFTWRDDSIPEAAPPEILEIWDEMNHLVDAKAGGLQFEEVHEVTPTPNEAGS